MKNGTIAEQLDMQKREIKETTRMQPAPQNPLSGERRKITEQALDISDLGAGLGSALGILTPEPGNEEHLIKPLKKKKIQPKKGIRRG